LPGIYLGMVRCSGVVEAQGVAQGCGLWGRGGGGGGGLRAVGEGGGERMAVDG
jgi:hypothetical protein